MNKLYRSGTIKGDYLSGDCKEYLKNFPCDIASGYYHVKSAETLRNSECYNITESDKVRLKSLVKNGYWWVNFK